MKSRADLLSSVRLSLRKRRPIMAQNIISKGNYFLVGLGVGSLIGVLFAPKSGEETREYLAKKASEGNKFARKQARELRSPSEPPAGGTRDVALSRAADNSSRLASNSLPYRCRCLASMISGQTVQAFSDPRTFYIRALQAVPCQWDFLSTCRLASECKCHSVVAICLFKSPTNTFWVGSLKATKR
jgi:hypothetical protein